jgi:hypothetical protein
MRAHEVDATATAGRDVDLLIPRALFWMRNFASTMDAAAVDFERKEWICVGAGPSRERIEGIIVAVEESAPI